jgi:carbamoyltransferase
VQAPDAQQGSLLGPSVDDDESLRQLVEAGAVYHVINDETELCDYVADLIAQGNVVGWVQGRMEFGPRALGGRSILGDARNPEMQSVMNVKIKFRESFRPFAPSVLRARAVEYFELDAEHESPYMLLVAPVQEEQRLPDMSAGLTGIDKLKSPRSLIPAVTHVDYSARVQTVDERSGRYYSLLRAFERRTGCAVLINTSFNVRGEPIVCTAADAYRCFLATNMDVLVVGNAVMLKQDHVALPAEQVEKYLGAFALD